MMKKFILALISMSLLLASGCAHIEEYDTEETADTEETTEVQTVTVDNPEYYTRFKNDGISINVYNWGEYIPDGSEEGVLNLNAEFTKLTGITVNYSTYATNEELYAKLKGGGSTYDIIIPSDYMISRMIKENMLEPLDKSNIPNFANIMDKFKSSEYDPGSKYSVPYTWGTVGIIYDTTVVDEEDIGWDILWDEDYSGGILMFGRDFEGLTKDEVKEKIQNYQDKSDIPLIIGADEEGGTVVRVSSNPNLAPGKFKSPQEIYNEGGMDAVVENATEKSELLLSLGVNMNLAPVADVSTNPSDYMYDRSLGQNAEVTADFVSKTVTAMNNAGIMSVLKHFPGYGGVGGDSHQGTVYDDKTAESIRENDLLPFKAGIEAGASSVLVAHNTVNALDSENPASLSPTIHNMLRDECGFDGVIMTDDIAMGAVADMENVYVKAVNAGNDLLITTDYQTGYNQILNAVKCGEISEETLNSAVERVLKMKGQI